MKAPTRKQWIVTSIAAVALVGVIALSTALAQPRDGNDRGGPQDRSARDDRGGRVDRGDRGDRDRQPPPRDDRDGRGDFDRPRGAEEPEGPRGPGGPGGPGGQLRMMRDLLGLMDDFRKVAESPSASSIAAVMSIRDLYRDPRDAAEFLAKLLPDVKDPIVVRAIRLQLVDHYKHSDQKDKAKEQLEKLILNK